jgi:phospholipid-binding lipoprotein MlaA
MPYLKLNKPNLNQEIRNLANNIQMKRYIFILLLPLLSACASTTRQVDPFESFNRKVYTFNDTIDRAAVKPIAQAYVKAVPNPIRAGVSNILSNLNDISVALNNILQGKLKNAFSDLGRFTINTTVGLFGIFDVASTTGLDKNDEDFGQTLGYWGIGDGPYIVLPFFGPSNLRDSVSRFVDIKTSATNLMLEPKDRNILFSFNIIHRRSQLLNASNILSIAAIDEYEFVRDAYFQKRLNQIYDGNPPRIKDDETTIELPIKSATINTDDIYNSTLLTINNSSEEPQPD